MNTTNDAEWQPILTLLLKATIPEIGGREGIPTELHTDLERLARGELQEEDIRKVCDRLVDYPEALSTIARLLRESKEEDS